MVTCHWKRLLADYRNSFVWTKFCYTEISIWNSVLYFHMSVYPTDWSYLLIIIYVIGFSWFISYHRWHSYCLWEGFALNLYFTFSICRMLQRAHTVSVIYIFLVCRVCCEICNLMSFLCHLSFSWLNWGFFILAFSDTIVIRLGFLKNYVALSHSRISTKGEAVNMKQSIF